MYRLLPHLRTLLLTSMNPCFARASDSHLKIGGIDPAGRAKNGGDRDSRGELGGKGHASGIPGSCARVVVLEQML